LDEVEWGCKANTILDAVNGAIDGATKSLYFSRYRLVPRGGMTKEQYYIGYISIDSQGK
jgi:DNA helicase IV